MKRLTEASGNIFTNKLKQKRCSSYITRQIRKQEEGYSPELSHKVIVTNLSMVTVVISGLTTVIVSSSVT